MEKKLQWNDIYWTLNPYQYRESPFHDLQRGALKLFKETLVLSCCHRQWTRTNLFPCCFFSRRSWSGRWRRRRRSRWWGARRQRRCAPRWGKAARRSLCLPSRPSQSSRVRLTRFKSSRLLVTSWERARGVESESESLELVKISVTPFQLMWCGVVRCYYVACGIMWRGLVSTPPQNRREEEEEVRWSQNWSRTQLKNFPESQPRYFL